MQKTGKCPQCQHRAHNRHSTYMRVIDDLSIQGKQVQLYLKTRKWFCTNAFCETKVFTERFEWLLPYKQRTVRLDKVLRTIAFSTHCIEAPLVTRILGMPVSHDTLLRLIQTTEMPKVHSPFCRY
ncbi:transposase family protein [Salinicoccus albus]|uniref:transposase family protein n=1 Tax=Salinicoccus albus TaxID=418756 RepID=UPI000A00272B|nr:transposase family protein [Salinicoccus albus]